MFISKYKLTEVAPGGVESVLSQFALSNTPAAGVYENGFLTVLDVSLAKSLLLSWCWLLGDQAVPLVSTAFGDLFFWDKKSSSVKHLDVQYGRTEFVDNEVEWFINEFLVMPEVANEVLKKSKFDDVLKGNRKLEYGECFILEPWQMLGGVDKAENYGAGQLDTYVDLVGQTHKKQ